MYRVAGSNKLYPRSEVDFGHIVDVAVYYQFAFLVESEFAMKLAEGTASAVDLETISKHLRHEFINTPRNVVPELPGANQWAGREVGKQVQYARSMTFKQAWEHMLTVKGTMGPASGDDPLVVLAHILDRLDSKIPDSEFIAKWRNRLAQEQALQRRSTQ